MVQAMQPKLATTSRQPVDTDLPWRVLSLLNVFRLLLPMLLLLVFFFDAPTQSVGSRQPGLFLATAAAYFIFALLCVQSLSRRMPSATWQAMIQLAVDAVAMAAFIHSSGGVASDPTTARRRSVPSRPPSSACSITFGKCAGESQKSRHRDASKGFR